MIEPFPWDEAMRLGLGILRWSPGDFWRATPRELLCAWRALSPPSDFEPALAADLRRLMALFPDMPGQG